MKRRAFLGVLGAAGATGLLDRAAWSAPSAAQAEPAHDPWGVLVDTTRCIGCRSCESACAEANGLPEPPEDGPEGADRLTTTQQLTAVQRFETAQGEVFVKRQCMHCIEPGCAAACLTKAMNKTEDGPVEWRAGKCMGCRYCMMSCPFEMPRFEYDAAVPNIRKCELCKGRLAEGKVPACVENCSGDALLFGRRSELIAAAHKRFVENPETYHPQIYGEREVGGTSWLYLAAVPFDQIGLRTDLGDTAYPEYTRDFLTAVPVVLTLGPAMMLALQRATQQPAAHAARLEKRLPAAAPAAPQARRG